MPAPLITEDDVEDYYGDYEPLPGAFCDQYVVHDEHVYGALNSNVYQCPGFTAEDLAFVEAEAAQEPCEHGLSLSLCAGPMHYPADM
jgi:hypothetical protein